MSQVIEDGGVEYVEHNGQRRILSCLPPKADSGFRSYQAGNTLVPRSEWVDVDFSHALTGIKDQNGRGACVGHGATSALETSINLSGHTKQSLSAWFTYSNINGGQDAGAVVSDALQFLKATGTCLDASVKYGTYIKSQIKPAAFEEAKRFKIIEAYSCSSPDEIGSAIQRFEPVVFGVCIGNRFAPNSQGIIPPWDGRNVGGHCMFICGMKQIAGKWYFRVANSWDKTWGDGGYCWMDESYFVGQRWGVDAFSVQSISHDPTEPAGPVARGG